MLLGIQLELLALSTTGLLPALVQFSAASSSTFSLFVAVPLPHKASFMV
jgi:hypothetical protein